MIRYLTGNLLESDADALVNTVNTVGVMGKGIALMFKEAFPNNYRSYRLACKRNEVRVGHMFVTQSSRIDSHKWIINFPTKEDWRRPSQLGWIVEGLADLKRVIRDRNIHSIALPPLGAGNGGLEWSEVRSKIEEALQDLRDVDILVYEPTATYQNVAKRTGVQKLTPARALIGEVIRRYSILGIECTLLEVQKLAWFIEMSALDQRLESPLQLNFNAHRYGPYADELRHLLDGLDGSYLHSEKRISDAGPLDTIWFDSAKQDVVELFINTEARNYATVLERTTRIIDGFESPFGMELLATVDWLRRSGVRETVADMRAGIESWPGGPGSAERKMKIFDERLIGLALKRLTEAAPLS
jgi:O-acetyl-ADP-ribose deacetylase (regulator of RNase III)